MLFIIDIVHATWVHVNFIGGQPEELKILVRRKTFDNDATTFLHIFLRQRNASLLPNIK